MKKNWILAVLLALCVFAAGAACAETLYVDTVNGGNVNLRDGAGTEYPVLCHVPYGAAVTVIDNMCGSSWAHVVYDGYYGYIAYRYLSDTRPYRTPAPVRTPVPVYPVYTPVPDAESELADLFSNFTHVNYQAVVTPSTPSGYVNMRWAPTKSAPIMARFLDGQTLTVLQIGDGWSQVLDPDTKNAGFIMTKFLVPIDGTANDEG